MPLVKRSLLVSHSAAKMYDIVNRIEDYPEFIPWCQSSEILTKSESEITARLDFARGGFQKSFTTCNRLQPNKMIELRLVDGPFHQLEGFWRFEEIDEHASKVMFDLEYEFSNKLLEFTFGPVFSTITNTMIDAFKDRADKVYGVK